MHHHNFRETAFIPTTSMPVGVASSSLESTIYHKWINNSTYRRLKGKNENPFILQDFPQSIEQEINLGTAFNKILKDIIVKFQYFNERNVEFVPCWNGQDLLESEIKEDKEIERFIAEGGLVLPDKTHGQKCREYVVGKVDEQKTLFQELGIVADWDHPYLTTDKDYEFFIHSKFQEFYLKHLVENKRDIVDWSIVEKRILNKEEIKQKKEICTSVSVLLNISYTTFPESFLVHYDYLWQIAGTTALILHPDEIYSVVRLKGFSQSVVISDKNIANYKHLIINQVQQIKGSSLCNLKVSLFDKEIPVLTMNNFLNKENSFSGIVPLIPGHNKYHYKKAIEKELPIINILDDSGNFCQSMFKGNSVANADKVILRELRDRNQVVEFESSLKVVNEGSVVRSKDIWVLNLKKIKGKALSLLEKIDCKIINSKERLKTQIESISDIIISEEGNWGIPIAFFRNKEPVFHKEVLGKTNKVFKEEGVDVWFEKDRSYFNPDKWSDTKFYCIDNRFEKDSKLINSNFINSFVGFFTKKQADLCVEPKDSENLLYSLCFCARQPKQMLIHGIVVDQDGNKISNNKVSLKDIVEKYGSEIVRFWVASVDKQKDIVVSEDTFKLCFESYKMLRNSLRHLVMALGDQRHGDTVLTHMSSLDCWILKKAQITFDQVWCHWKVYNFHVGLNKLLEFIREDLYLYVNQIKDCIYFDYRYSGNKYAINKTVQTILKSLMSLIAPVFTFTVDEVLSHCPDWFKYSEEEVFDLRYEAISTFTYNFDERFWKDALKEFELKVKDLKLRGIIKDSLELYLQIPLWLECSSSWFGVSECGLSLEGECLSEFFIFNSSMEKRKFKIIRSNQSKCERCFKRTAEKDLCARCKSVVLV